MFRLILPVFLLALTLFAKEDIEVIAIGVGEKNVTLDESQFRNISVYYTPGITVSHEALGKKKFSGKPSFLVEWMSATGEANDFLVLGSNGVVYDQGKSIIAGRYMSDVETERRGEFSKAIEGVNEKGRTLRESRKEIDFEDEKGFVKRKLPAFTLTTTNGDKVSSKAVLENGKAKLVIFFYLNPDTYIGAEKDEGAKVRSKEYMRGRMESAGGVEGVRALIQVEREIFGNIIHDIY